MGQLHNQIDVTQHERFLLVANSIHTVDTRLLSVYETGKVATFLGSSFFASLTATTLAIFSL